MKVEGKKTEKSGGCEVWQKMKEKEIQIYL